APDDDDMDSVRPKRSRSRFFPGARDGDASPSRHADPGGAKAPPPHVSAPAPSPALHKAENRLPAAALRVSQGPDSTKRPSSITWMVSTRPSLHTRARM